MKKFTTSFIKNDDMNINTYIHSIQLPELTREAREAASAASRLAPWPIEEAWKYFTEQTLLFFQSVNEKPEAQRLYLYYYLAFTRFARQDYQREGISDQIFFDTFSDIGRWEQVCFRHTGIHGLEEYEWLALHLQRKLYALGRLQFQPIPCPQDIHIPGLPALKKGQPVLNVHIPSGQKLTHSLCLESYRQAEAFFHPSPAAFLCHSWLLSPALPRLLPPASNILRFQQEYSIYQTDPASRQAEERIFGVLKEHPSQYPAHSHLQAAARQWLMAGNLIPEGYGVRRLSHSIS